MSGSRPMAGHNSRQTVVQSDAAKLQTTVTQGTLNWNVVGDVTTTPGVMQQDAFGRLRVSNPQTLFDGKHLYDSNPLLYDGYTTGSGASVGVPGTTAQIVLSVNANGSKTIRQSRRYLVYQPGKSQLDMLTCVLNPDGVTSGVVRRVGIFDSATEKTFSGTEVSGNGYFFQLSGTTLSVVRRSYVTGSMVDTAVAQGVWNGDNLNGLGSSGVTLDTTKNLIFFIDQEWLGAGSVRMGIVHNGAYIIAHTWHHDNAIAVMHTQSATLPVRYEISRTSGSGAATLTQGCATCISEGGYNPKGSIHTAYRPSVVSCGTGAWVPIVTIRTKPANCRASIIPLEYSALTTSANQPYMIGLWHGVANLIPATLTGVSWGSVSSYSLSQYDVASTAISGGRLVDVHVVGSSDKGIEHQFDMEMELASSIIGEPDTLSVVGLGIGSSANILASINWRETF